jgi:arginine deiminase
MTNKTDLSHLPAYGGPGWQPRGAPLRQELGTHWARCGMDSEWRTLKSVLLHPPGRELDAAQDDPEAHLLREAPDPEGCQAEHEALAQAYRDEGVAVHLVAPPSLPPPNQMFVADLMVMTPEGAIVGRPASEVRAGEERWVGRALGMLGIPILRSVRGEGAFEGADLMWVDPGRALLARGLRTNDQGAAQVRATLEELGVEVVETVLPAGTMHLMGQLRIVDRDLAVAWPGRFPAEAAASLEERGIRVVPVPDEALPEALESFGLNFVVLGPRRILMPAGNPRSQAFYEELGIRCRTVEVEEIGKAAGSIGCLTGVLERVMDG